MLSLKLLEDFQFNDQWPLERFTESIGTMPSDKSNLPWDKLQVESSTIFYYLEHDYTRDFNKPAVFPIFLYNSHQHGQLQALTEYIIKNRELFASKKLIPVILDVLEGHPWLPQWVEAVADAVKDICTVYFVDGNKFNESLPTVKYYYYYFWLYYAAFNLRDMPSYYKFDNTVVHLDEDHKIYMCLNRLAREHRLVLVTTLIERELRHDGYITWSGKPGTPDWQQIYPKVANESFDVLDVVDIATDNPTDKFPTDFVKKSFIFVNTETHFDNQSMFLSEKAFKPMVLGMPFILLGNPGVLGFLKSLGFKTFDKWIDESYDNDIPLQARCDIIANEIQRFSLMAPQERIQLRHEMHETTQHNIQTLTDLARSNKFYSIFQNIEDVALNT